MFAIPIPDWTRDAACASVGSDFWFPEKGVNASHAKKVCASCPVQTECGEYALANLERYGVWGGVTERERRKLVDLVACGECGTDFRPQVNRSRTYCSEDCSMAARRRQKAAHEARRPPRPSRRKDAA